MKQAVSNAKINGTAATLLALPAAFGPVTITTGLLIAFGFRGWINRPLNNRGAGLGYNLRNRFCHSILGQGVGQAQSVAGAELA